MAAAIPASREFGKRPLGRNLRLKLADSVIDLQTRTPYYLQTPHVSGLPGNESGIVDIDSFLGRLSGTLAALAATGLASGPSGND